MIGLSGLKKTKEDAVDYTPSEVAIGGIYFPPLLLASILGVVAAWLTVMLLNRYRLSRFFYYPPLVFLAMAVVYTGLIGTFFIPV
jgi:hypothetical protein